MSTRVEVVYQLIDRISTRADKISKKVERLEKTLERTDAHVTELGKNRAFDRFATRAVNSAERINKKIETSNRRFQSLGRHVDTTGRKMESLDKKLGGTNEKLRSQNQALGSLATSAKHAARDISALGDSERGLSTHLSGVTRKAVSQKDALARLNREAMLLDKSLEKIIHKEEELAVVMAAKNHEARAQRGHLSNISREGDKASKTMNRLGKETGWLGKELDKLAEHSYFQEGFGFGIKMFQALKKVAGILPVIGVGFGGLTSMIGGLTAGMGGLIGSVGRLAGALGLLPGLYGAIGVAAVTAKGIQGTIIKPAMEGTQKLKQLNQQIASTKATIASGAAGVAGGSGVRSAGASVASALSANQHATTVKGAASTGKAVDKANTAYDNAVKKQGAAQTKQAANQQKLNDLLKQQAVLQKTIPKQADEFNKKLQTTKDTWQTLWWGKDGARATQIMAALVKGLGLANRVLKLMDPTAQIMADNISKAVGQLDALSKNPLFKNGLTTATETSAKNFGLILDIATNLAPVALAIADAAMGMTNSALKGVKAWSETYTHADKVKSTSEKAKHFFHEGLKSLKLWGTAIYHFARGFGRLVLPMADEFDKRLKGLSKRFDDWSKKVTGNGGNKAFTKNGFKVLDAMGRVMLSMAGVIGKIGRDKAASKSVIEFLDLLAGGISKFGGFALTALKQLGPELNDFFKTFAKAHAGSGKIILAMATRILDFSNGMLGLWAKFPPSGSIFGAMVALGMLQFAIGHMAGVIAGPVVSIVSGLKKLGGAVVRFHNTVNPTKKPPVGTHGPTRDTLLDHYRGKGKYGQAGVDELTKSKGFLSRFGGSKLMSKAGKIGGHLASGANFVADATAKPVSVTNTILNPVPVIIVGGGKGLGKSLLGDLVGPGGGGGVKKPRLWRRLLGSKAIKEGENAAEGAGLLGAAERVKAMGVRGAVKAGARGAAKRGARSGPLALIGLTVADGVADSNYRKNYNKTHQYGGIPSVSASASMGVEKHLFSNTHDLEGYPRNAIFNASKQNTGNALAGTIDPYINELVQNGLRAANSKKSSGNGGGGLGNVLDTVKSLGKNVQAGFGDATAKTKTGGTKWAQANNAAGKQSTKALAGWVAQVRSLLASLGMATAPAPAGGGSSPTASSSAGAGGAATGGGGSNGPRTGDSVMGSGAKTVSRATGGGGAGGGFDGHPGNVAAGLSNYVNTGHQDGLTVTATTDHSKYTTSGNISNHFLGKAVDMAGSTAAMDKLYADLVPYARSGALSELIHRHNGWSHGQSYNYGADDHFNHVHFAIGSGAGPVGSGGAATIPALPGFGNTVFGQAVAGLAGNARQTLMDRLNSGGGADAGGAGGGNAGSDSNAYKQYAQGLLANYGWSNQFPSLDALWTQESGWNPAAVNKSSGAWGIPQALPGNKMASAGPDWRTNAATQIQWGLDYIKGRYGSPDAAEAHEKKIGWYGNGGDFIAKKPQLIGVGDGGHERVQITPKRRAPGNDLNNVGGGSGLTINAHIDLKGAVITSEDGIADLTDRIGASIAAEVRRARQSTVKDKDI